MCARNHANHFAYIISLNPLSKSVRWELAKVTGPLRGRGRIEPRQPDSRTKSIVLTARLYSWAEGKLLEKGLTHGSFGSRHIFFSL